MKIFRFIPLVFVLTAFAARAEETAPEDAAAKHREGSQKVAEEQDELSADVQQLVIEQTVPQVIELLSEVEDIMDETSGWLTESDTGGRTLAAQTEIIEKIHAAAKERQKQQGGGQSGEAMMEMMERMMGQKPGGDKPGDKPGEKPGDQGGKGMEGESDTANQAINGQAGGKSEERRIPKAAGNAGQAIPEEFRKAFDAYNRGAGEKQK